MAKTTKTADELLEYLIKSMELLRWLKIRKEEEEKAIDTFMEDILKFLEEEKQDGGEDENDDSAGDSEDKEDGDGSEEEKEAKKKKPRKGSGELSAKSLGEAMKSLAEVEKKLGMGIYDYSALITPIVTPGTTTIGTGLIDPETNELVNPEAKIEPPKEEPAPVWCPVCQEYHEKPH